jgi:hypothetical protein
MSHAPEEDGAKKPADSTSSDAGSERQRSRPSSLKSWRSKSRSRSRPSRNPDAHLHRIYSANFVDDHGTYVSEHDHRDREREAELASELGPRAAEFLSTAAEGEEEDEGKQGLEEVESEKDRIRSAEDEEREPAGAEDLEKGLPSKLSRSQTARSNRSTRKDPNLVTWDGPDDPENPKNWKNGRKWAAVLVVSSFTFISPVSSSMVAPALTNMDRDLGIHDEVTSQMM